MRTPRARGLPVNLQRLRAWHIRFAGYRHHVDHLTVRGWLDQFHARHQDVAARILDAVDFFTMARIGAAFRTALDAIPGWSPSARRRNGRWMFSAMSVAAGESGDSMLHQFRVANGITNNALVCQPSEIVTKKLGADDTLVLVDDFIGTGNQVCDAWDNSFSELAAGIGRVFLVVAVARRAGRQKVSTETGLQVVAPVELDDADDLFSAACNHFTAEEKQQVLHYCRVADQRNPRGYGDCGLVVVMQHRCPNDSIPILHRDGHRWIPIFPRNG